MLAPTSAAPHPPSLLFLLLSPAPRPLPQVDGGQTKAFHFLSINCGGMTSRLRLPVTLLVVEDVDIVCLQEAAAFPDIQAIWAACPSYPLTNLVQHSITRLALEPQYYCAASQHPLPPKLAKQEPLTKRKRT